MNARYVYRAKSVKSGRWLQGNVREVAEGTFAILVGHQLSNNPAPEFLWSPVQSDTICGCTTKRDQRNRLIFEFDIVDYEGDLWICIWDAQYLQWTLKGHRRMLPLSTLDGNKARVVGNKFDNPEYGSWGMEY